jgi:hypothetical protein
MTFLPTADVLHPEPHIPIDHKDTTREAYNHPSASEPILASEEETQDKADEHGEAHTIPFFSDQVSQNNEQNQWSEEVNKLFRDDEECTEPVVSLRFSKSNGLLFLSLLWLGLVELYFTELRQPIQLCHHLASALDPQLNEGDRSKKR